MATETTLKEGRGDRQSRKVIKIKGPNPQEKNLVCLIHNVPVDRYHAFSPDVLIEPARIEPVEEKSQRPRKKVRLYVIPEGSIDALMLSPEEREARRKKNFEKVLGSEKTQEADIERYGKTRIHNNSFNDMLFEIYKNYAADLSPNEFVELVHGVYNNHKGKLDAILDGPQKREDKKAALKKYHKRIFMPTVLNEIGEKAYFMAYGKVVERCFKVIKRILHNEFEAYVKKYNKCLAEKAIADGVPERKVRMNGTPDDLEFNATSLCKNYLGMKRPGVMPDTTFREEVCDILRTGEDSYKKHIVKNDDFKSYVTEMLFKVRTAYADAIESAKAKLDSLVNMGGRHEKKASLPFYLAPNPAMA